MSVNKYNSENDELIPIAGNVTSSSSYIKSYIVGSTPFASDWLAKTDGGSPLIPAEKKFYLVKTAGDYENFLFVWDSTQNLYIQSSGGSEGSGGHIILDGTTELEQRENLSFNDFELEDDESTDSIKIKPHIITDEELAEIVYPLPVIPGSATKPIVYAFQIDGNESDPSLAVTPYLSEYGCDNAEFVPVHMDFTNDRFDYGSWTGKEFFFPRPCMLKYDGTVDYYLDPNDYTKKLNGEDSDVANSSYSGNVMVEFPTVYFKRWQVNNISYCVISNKQINNSFHAYAHHDVNGDVAEHIYIAAYDGALVSGKLRSLSGYSANTSTSPTTNRIMTYSTRQEEINYAKANNVRTDCEGWSIWHKADRDMVNDLLILLSMNLNSQAIFGRGRDTGYSSASSTGIVTTGSMNTKGLFWGENAGSAGVKVFGIENWWGNYSKSVQGYINDKGTQKVKMTYGKEDGTEVNGFNFDGSGYCTIYGATPTGTSSGYISKWKYSKEGLVPYEASGSNSTYLCDGMWFTNSSVTYAVVGGMSYYGVRCGFGCVFLYSLSSDRWDMGAALSYKPLASV